MQSSNWLEMHWRRRVTRAEKWVEETAEKQNIFPSSYFHWRRLQCWPTRATLKCFFFPFYPFIPSLHPRSHWTVCVLIPFCSQPLGWWIYLNPRNYFPNWLDPTLGAAVRESRCISPKDQSRGRRHLNRFRPTVPARRRLTTPKRDVAIGGGSRSSWRSTRSRSVWHLKDVFPGKCSLDVQLWQKSRRGNLGGWHADATVHIIRSCVLV